MTKSEWGLDWSELTKRSFALLAAIEEAQRLHAEVRTNRLLSERLRQRLDDVVRQSRNEPEITRPASFIFEPTGKTSDGYHSSRAAREDTPQCGRAMRENKGIA